MAQNKLLERLGIVRHVLVKDIMLFFIPWLTVEIIELSLCERYGDGFSGLWRNVWGLIKQPKTVVVLPIHRTVGLVLFMFGLLMMIVSQVTLWDNYSGFVVIRKNHQLITHGIYHFTRNPIYLGALIVFAGLPIYAASLYGFLTLFLMILIFLQRIKLEEQLLAEKFQDAYQKFKETTKKLIPFIY